MSPVLPKMRMGAHVDVFKDVGGKKTLVQTSRKCRVCQQDLTGMVIPDGAGQIHASCKGGR